RSLASNIMHILTVNLGDCSYPIYLGEGLLSRTGELLKKAGSGKKVGIVSNQTVADLYLDPVQESLTRSGFRVIPIFVPEGEEHKNLKSISDIFDRLISERFERSSSLIALGGGVIGDLAGFAAATFLRGIPYIQIPTTLLAQVDASVGGKTGVNHQEGKNLIGAFYQPRLVLIDLEVLRTLPKNEFVAGLAEVIKYGIIEDPQLFALLEANLKDLLSLNRGLLEKAVAASCTIKARVVEKDEHEEDYRSVLNFGHTIGHALESLTGYEQFLHGEAVAIGMAQAATISRREGLCDDKSLERILQLIKGAGLPTDIPSGIRLEELANKMEVDKKSVGGKIKFVLCAGIGKTQFHWLSAEDIIARLAPIQKKVESENR
ncbi:MAG: 3-dehydroquinate synthase, partial [Candidatus Binatia bacterium]